MNIYGEILNDSDKPIHIKPYMELIQIIINSKAILKQEKCFIILK